MKKVAFVSYGHVDVSISLIQNFRENVKDIEINLIIVFAQNKKKESIIDFEYLDVHNGFQDENITRQILGPDLNSYCKNIDVKIFIYENLKAKSFKNLWLSLGLLRTLRKYDIIHVSGQDGTLIQILPFLKSKQIIHTVHDLIPHSGEGENNISMVSKFIFDKSDRVIIQNKDDEAYFKKTYKSRPIVSYIPIGSLDVYKSYSSGIQSNCDIDVLFFGRISKYKGLEYLLEALRILNKTSAFKNVVLAGSGNYDFGLANYDFGNKVTFINRHLSNKDLVELIERARIVVCPYTDATQSGVLMTAMAFNKPVIAAAVNGFKDVIVNGENGILVKPKNAMALKDAIQLLLTNTKLERQISENLKNKAIENFSRNKITKSLQNIYKSSK